MSYLVIVESPAKAKTISNFLGKNYRVEASYGHVRDLPAGKKEVPAKFRAESWSEYGVNIEKDYEPIYIVSKEKKKQIDHLKKLLEKSEGLLLATDEDREGESISWHLLEVLKPKSKEVQRIVFHEITREAIREALENPRDIDTDLVRAQESRRILDRLFGYKLSPLLWRKVQPGLSAGRVQSVAVRLIVEREEERRAFKKSEYWDLEAEIGGPGRPFKATLASVDGRRLATGKDFNATTGELENKKAYLIDEKHSGELLDQFSGALPWEVRSVQERPATNRPAPPFTTSTLQQEANRKLRFSASRTMRTAQRLYEGVDIGGGERVGLITYMRTDSVSLSDKALNDAQKVIKGTYGPDYAKGRRPYKTKTRNAQEAHEAIRPTEIHRKPADLKAHLNRDELAIYELIWKRTMASQMPDARLLRSTVEIAARAEKGAEGIFTATGKKILFPGFLRAYVEGSDDPAADIGDKEVILPDLKEGQKILSKNAADPQSDYFLENLENKQHETNPPARYTEAALVKKLEEESIGRPSTYASIISTIMDRGYVWQNKSGQLVPTFTAMAVTELLRKHFPEYVDIRFTARMEDELDLIANGKMKWVDHLRTFFEGSNGIPGLKDEVESKQKEIDFPRIHLGVDPETGDEIKVRVGKFGPFVTRGDGNGGTAATVPKGTPPADFTVDEALKLLSQKEEGPRVVGHDPQTDLPIYAMTGRFGDYVQLGEASKEKGAPKPRRASLEKGQDLDTLSLDEALELLSYPKEIGKHPESGEPVLVNKGKYGPYIQHKSDRRSLKKEDAPETITLDRALELLAEPKGAGRRGASAKKVLKELGEHDGVKLQVLDGRYGPYVTDGKKNATLPKDSDPEAVSVEQAQELLAAKKSKARKSPGGKTSAKKKTK